jgi:uncharacterized peroxidase-related enzyme
MEDNPGVLAGATATADGPWVERIPWSDATGTLKDAYDWQAKSLGEPAEFTQLGSMYPDLVMERLRLYKVVEGAPSGLSPLERRLAAYVTSTLTQTPHCSSGLVHKLDDVGVSPELMHQVRTDPLQVASGDERTDAIVVYSAKLTLSPGAMVEADIARLRAAGLSDLDIVDLNNIVAYYNYTNRVANGLGLRTEIPPDHARNALPR